MSELLHRPGDSRPAVAAGWVAIAVSFAALAAWSWGKWPDILVDFGRELYVPWRIVEGDVLYADVAYFNGPFSPYWNALWFGTFGVGLSTLVGVNLAITAAITALIYRGARSVSDAATAAAASIVFLCVFAFGHLVTYGNYNFVTPYSHDLVHGFALALLALGCASRASCSRSRRWSFAAGVCLGSTFLTKAEVFAAAVCGVAACWGAGRLATSSRSDQGLRAAPLLAGFAVPIAVCGALLSMAMPASQAGRGMLGSWPGIWGGETGALRFYRHWLGADDVWRSVGKMLFEFAGVVAIGLPAAVLDRVMIANGPLKWGVAAVVFAVVLGALLAFDPNWMQVGRSLPLLAGLWIVVAWRRVRRGADVGQSGGSGRGGSDVLAVGFAVFSFVLLGKMLLFARMFHYGFALAAPAVIVSVVGMLAWLPAELRRLGGSGSVVAAAALALIVSATLGYLEISDRRYATKVTPVAQGADAFLARGERLGPLGGRATAIESALERIAELPTEATLLVVPEGVMLNYLARRANPTPYINFLPPELILFGEDSIIAAMDANPPDMVLLVHKDTREYGHPFFGRDYGVELMRWVSARYAPSAAPIGDRPLEPGSRFGIQILEPKRGPSQSTSTGG